MPVASELQIFVIFIFESELEHFNCFIYYEETLAMGQKSALFKGLQEKNYDRQLIKH